MAFTEDFSVFFNASDFAKVVTFNAAPVTAIFDNAYERVDIASGLASTEPALTLATADVPAKPTWPSTAVVVDGTSYTIYEHKPDGTGVSVIFLRRA